MSKKPIRPIATGQSSPMDPGLLEQIVKLMAANDLNTVDVRDGERRIILKRGANVTYATTTAAAPAAPTLVPAPAGATSPNSAVDPNAGLTPILSEMVGTFYSKPSPDAKPFVSVGSQVNEETVICVIEAMKHFNPVKAEISGTIVRILVSDGEVVDVKKPLFLVKPN